MSLIKCVECNNEISDKAFSCPHCGCPIELQQKEPDKIKFIKLYESISKMTILFHFLLSFSLLLIICLPLKYANNYTGSFSILELYFTGNADYMLKLFPFGLIIFINFFISIFTGKKSYVSKIIYIISLIFYIYINYIVINEGFQLDYVYVLMYLVISILILIRRKFTLKEEEIEILEEEKEALEDNNKKLRDIYDKKEKIFPTIIMFVLLVGLGFVSSKIFMNKENQAEIPLNKIVNINQVKDGYVMYVKVTNDYINLRSEADTDSKRIGEVVKNDEYQVIDIETDGIYTWYKIIDKNNNEGYIANPKANKNYVKLFQINDNENIDKDKYEFKNMIEDKKDTDSDSVNNNSSQENKPASSKPVTKPSSSKPAPSSKPVAKPSSSSKPVAQPSSSSKPAPSSSSSKPKDDEEAKKKEECNKKILDRTAKYETDKQNLDDLYTREANSIKNNLDMTERQLRNYGGYIDYYSYNRLNSSLNSELRTAQTNYQRALMDTSGASNSARLRYQNQIRELTKEIADLEMQYELSCDLEALEEDYEDTLNQYKWALQNLYDEFEADLDKIEASC